MTSIDEKRKTKKGDDMSEVAGGDDIVNVDATDGAGMDADSRVGPDHNVSASSDANINTKEGPVSVNKYDQLPYESFPYPQTRPDHLRSVAKIFGLDAADVKNCRVLEIGCASGGNIIPMALENPGSKFVGIDLSKVQINKGNADIKAIGIENVELKEVSILDIGEDFGEFDYIIAHGILSWVPKDVQDKIFQICGKNLSENGVAYISYNTLPGWNSIQSIRDMMLYHTAGFDSPEIKAQQSRLLLEFIKEANEGHPDTSYAKLISSEIDTLSKVGNSYLMHDHLEEINDPCYFYQFMQNASKNGLQYLGDAVLSSMFVGNMPQKIAEKLYSVGNDIVRTEQYMDFLTNRRFRSTLLCHASKQLNRNLNSDIVSNFYVASGFSTDKNLNPEIVNSSESVEFKSNRGAVFSATSPVAKAMLATLVEGRINTWNHMDEIFKSVMGRLKNGASEDMVKREISEIALRLLLSGLIDVTVVKPSFVTKVSDKPEVSKLVRFQATTQAWITDLCSEKKNLDVFGRVLVQYANGVNDVATIAQRMVDHFVKGELSIKDRNGNAVTDEAVLRKEMEPLVKRSLEAYAINALMVK